MYDVTLAEDGRYKKDKRVLSAFDLFKEGTESLAMPIHLKKIMGIVRRESGILRGGYTDDDEFKPEFRGAYELLAALEIVSIRDYGKKAKRALMTVMKASKKNKF